MSPRDVSVYEERWRVHVVTACNDGRIKEKGKGYQVEYVYVVRLPVREIDT